MHFPWQAPRIIINKEYGAQQMANTHTIMARDFAIFLSRCSLDPAFEEKEAEKFLLRAVELVSVRDGPLATTAGLHDLVSDETLSSASDEGDDAPGLGKPQNLQDELLLLGGSQSCTLPRRWRLWMLWKMCMLK